MSSLTADDIRGKAEQYVRWDPNATTRDAVRSMLDSGDDVGLAKVMSTRLAFGTAGLRGKMGPGYHAMNDLVVVQTTQGLAAYLESTFGTDIAHSRGVTIGYDHRATPDGSLSSKQFGLYAAAVLLERGFNVYLLESSGFAATPIVAYCTLAKKCAAGIMVTASHNPKEDCGYKLYWDNGAQIIPPNDTGIASAILAALQPWKAYDLEAVRKHPNCVDPTSEIADQYFQKAASSACFHASKHVDWNAQKDPLKIVYTAMHGVGHQWCIRSFDSFGLAPFFPVEAQVEPDPLFPTVTFPNPEEGKGALLLSIETAEKVKADIILANDPDADRLAVAERVGDTKEWKIFTGNEIGCLLGHWAWFNHVANGGTGENAVMLCSTVSSLILKAMAKKEGFVFEDTMTGFKFMGNRTEQLEKEGKTVLFAYEEAIGFCFGNIVRDKDGVVASAVFAEMAQYLRHEKGVSVSDHLKSLYEKYGYFAAYNGYFYWNENSTVDALFRTLRNGGNYQLRCGPYVIENVRDLTGDGYDSGRKNFKPLLPCSSSNMITYYFRNGCVCTFRLSGTEPKLKYYIELSAADPSLAASMVMEMGKFLIEHMLQPVENGLK